MMLLRKTYPMKSDVREKEDEYILEVNLPGYKKENIKAYIENGNLIVAASEEKEQEKAKKNYVQKERYTGAYKRSFYVGHNIRQEEIKASYKFGVLKLVIPKDAVDGTRTSAGIQIA